MVAKRRDKRSSSKKDKNMQGNNQSNQKQKRGGASTSNQLSDLLLNTREKEVRLKALNQMWCSYLRNVGMMFTALSFHKFMTQVLELKNELSWTHANHPVFDDMMYMVRGCFIEVLLSICLAVYLNGMARHEQKVGLSIDNEYLLVSMMFAFVRIIIAIYSQDSDNHGFRQALPALTWLFISLACIAYMQRSEKIANRNVSIIFQLQDDDNF